MSRGSNPTKVAQWSDRLDRFESSGQTVAQFCVTEGVSQPSFYQWKKKLDIINRVRGGKAKRSGRSNRGERPHRGKKSKSAFKPVPWTPTLGLQQSTMIRLADGVEIELGNNLQVVEMVVRSVVDQVLPGAAARSGGTPC
jgi:hypothetical protein